MKDLLRRHRVAVALVALVVVVTTFVLVRDDRPRERMNAEQAPKASVPEGQLRVEWTAALGADAVNLTVRRTSEMVAAFDTTSATGVARDTGEQVWRISLKGQCAVSEEADGVVAVVAGSTCSKVTLLDLDTGRRMWTVPVGYVDREELVVGVGDRTVSVVGDCAEVVRLSRAEGRRVGRIGPDGWRCPRSRADTDGQTILVHRPTDESEDTGQLAAYDADTGRRLWIAPAASFGSWLDLLSSDPLVVTSDVDVDVDAGRTTTRIVDRSSGRPGAALISGRLPASFLGRVGDVTVALTGDDSDTVRAYDLRTGKQVWARTVAYGGWLSGADEHGVIMVVPDEEDLQKRQVVRLGIDDGQQEVLGWVPSPDSPNVSAPFLLDGDFFGVLRSGGRVTAYDLPAPGEGLGDDPETTDAAPAGLTPDDVIDACTAVRPATLRSLGFRTDGPAPTDCVWHDYQGDPVRRLEVEVYAGRASSVSTAEEDAIEHADFNAGLLEDGPFAPTFVTPPYPQAVPGWGDEAWVSQGVAPNGLDSFTGVVVRKGNVVVTVQAYTDGAYFGAAPGMVAAYRLQRAVLDATEDVLRGLDIELRTPGGGKDGPLRQIGDLCAALATTAARYAPGETATGVTPVDPQQRVGACAWGDVLSVQAYAAPGSLFDRSSGTDLAEASYDEACGIADRVIRGLGDGACVWGFSDDGGEYRSRSLILRKGNLIVEVRYVLHGYPTRAGIDAAVDEIAAAVLANVA